MALPETALSEMALPGTGRLGTVLSEMALPGTGPLGTTLSEMALPGTGPLGTTLSEMALPAKGDRNTNFGNGKVLGGRWVLNLAESLLQLSLLEMSNLLWTALQLGTFMDVTRTL